MSVAKEKMTFADLESLICDADNMVDVLMDLLERHFGVVPDGRNYVLTQTEGNRLFFVASTAATMSMKAKKAYFEAVEGNVS
ncbi:hypothetical protein [Mesorhizobium sp.]|uniref:hypothetical protein n=1 Tax=Mesorhizobium sp. TaxID=1871066 RepID=UPI000FE33C5C|nr:hypothetical protein [Mesorhizobium sp.]RWN51937.1 MAG: hypothetical protein EOR98_24085 [Mesorhizobium sp.]RWN73054.1 MAG: hypothetical protein EOS02_25515 [Mesorhizobium sp.]RWN76236.1 MAG: hypothetical protein EOS01_21230 [Mesorhizobium sp.]RWN85982.1 MAG: hypothetical protein EOS04_20625 [Mesorhizobium sp.]RWO11747.1 MAG: hypothetical protein EOS15_21855 [Mesorhizobium sp.]